MKTLNIMDSPHSRWSVTLRFNFDTALKKWIKQFPGCWWDDKRKVWEYPLDLLPKLQTYAKGAGWYVHSFCKYGWAEPPYYAGPITASESGYTLHNFQERDARRMAMCKAFLLSYEMGLGKTPTTAKALRNPEDVLIIAPAMAIGHWLDEIPEWCGKDTPCHRSQPTSKKRWVTSPGVTLITYGLLRRFLKEMPQREWKVIVFDEIHMLANDGTQRTNAAQELVDDNPQAKVWGLTGTPITNTPGSVYTPLGVLFKHRFGPPEKLKHFKYRYMNHKPTDYGLNFFGVNKEHAPEFQERLDLFYSRVTKKDVAHLLPPFLGPFPIYWDGLGRMDTALDWLANSLDQGATHISMHTYKRAQAHLLAQMVERNHKDVKVFLLTGEDTAEQRDKKRKQAREAERAVIVSTISSTKVAIDMTFVDAVCYVELSNNLEEMMQSLGRYQRLSGKHTVTAYFMMKDKRDAQARRMLTKVKAVAMLLKPGLTEDNMQEALKDIQEKTKLDPAELKELAALAAASFRGDAGGTEDWKE